MPQLSAYRIEVRHDFETGSYRLYNTGWLAGDRLRRGDTKAQWPFIGQEHWNYFQSEGEAQTAAAALQRYLDKHEPKK